MLSITAAGFWCYLPTNPLNLVIHLSQVLLKAKDELAQLSRPVFLLDLNFC